MSSTPTTTPTTYGRGKLRINLNSPRGNLYSIWGVATNFMEQSHWSKEKISATLSELEGETYEDSLARFGAHKVFGSVFKLYSSPDYTFAYEEGEWGNPDEQEDEEEPEAELNEDGIDLRDVPWAALDEALTPLLTPEEAEALSNSDPDSDYWVRLQEFAVKYGLPVPTTPRSPTSR